MRITIKIDDDGGEQPRVAVSGATTAASGAATGSDAAAGADLGAPIDAGPAPDLFGTTGEAPPPGVTDLAADGSMSAGTAPDLS